MNKRQLDQIERDNNTRMADPADVTELIRYTRLLEATLNDRLNYDFEQAQAEQPRRSRKGLLFLLLIATIATVLVYMVHSAGVLPVL